MLRSGIPEELCREILIRLPVKSLLTCKCVCRSWLSLISSSDFVESHLQLNKNNSSSNHMVVVDIFFYEPLSVSYDLLESSLSRRQIGQKSVLMVLPFRSDHMKVLGSCNGLVFIWHLALNFLCVWNPAIRDYKMILRPSRNYALQSSICIQGVRYDSKNDDYKFLIGDWSDSVNVYSLRSNSWETFITPYRFPHDESIKHKSGVLVNGDLHWLAKAKHGVCIVYLDSNSDVPSFKEIQLPIIPNFKFVSVGELEEGCLCVVAHNGGCAGLGRVEVWEMQVYGDPKSWSKRYVISNETITQAVTNKFYGLKIMWSFKSGSIVFLDLLRVVLFDPKHGTAIVRREFDNYHAKYDSEFNYVESLVPIPSWFAETSEDESTEDESTEEESTEEESTEELTKEELIISILDMLQN